MGDNGKYNPETTNLFGHILIHFGYYGMRGDEDKAHKDNSFAKTVALFQEQFGNFPFVLADASDCGADCLFEINASDCGADCLFPNVADCGADCLFPNSRLVSNGVDLKRPTLADLVG